MEIVSARRSRVMTRWLRVEIWRTSYGKTAVERSRRLCTTLSFVSLAMEACPGTELVTPRDHSLLPIPRQEPVVMSVGVLNAKASSFVISLSAFPGYAHSVQKSVQP